MPNPPRKRSAPRPRVTRLRAEARGRVEVELDGTRWRSLPAEVVLGTGLDVGTELDRPRLRRLRAALREHEAVTRAARSLRRQDLSRRVLDERLARSGIAPASRDAALRRLAAAGAIDDERLARRRAELLAERGAGDAMIRADLLRRGIGEDLTAAALASLDPEPERARRLAEARGASRRTASYLARRGFAEESIETAVPDPVAEEG